MDVAFLFSFANTMLFHRVMDQFDAAQHGDLQQLRVALTVNNVNNRNVVGRTALHNAAIRGGIDCVNYCIEMGAHVSARSHSGYTPLHYASLNGHVNVVRVLLDAGALIDAADNYGDAPLYLAFCNKHGDVLRYLIDRGAKVSNVNLDNSLPSIPDWVTFIESRSNCRTVSIAIIGIHKYRRTNVTGNNDINVLQLISKHIWSTRMDDVWVIPVDTTR
jgi:ankyrin repeat protein